MKKLAIALSLSMSCVAAAPTVPIAVTEATIGITVAKDVLLASSAVYGTIAYVNEKKLRDYDGVDIWHLSDAQILAAGQRTCAEHFDICRAVMYERRQQVNACFICNVACRVTDYWPAAVSMGPGNRLSCTYWEPSW